jgi:hypothetical protein
MTLTVMHCFRLLQNRGETEKCLYLRLKSGAVSAFHGFGETFGVIWMTPGTAEIGGSNYGWRFPQNPETVKQADNSLSVSMRWLFHAALKQSETERSSPGRNWGDDWHVGRSQRQETHVGLPPVRWADVLCGLRRSFHFDAAGKVIANFGADTFAAPHGLSET